jgi:hypothetical protein
MVTLPNSIRDINQMSTKTEIILFIAAHGTDLQEELDVSLQRKPCLLFSLANKGSIAILPPETHSELLMDQYVINNFLIDELKVQSKPVITVLDNLKEKLYNEFKYPEYCKKKFKFFNELYNKPALREQAEESYKIYKKLVNDCENEYTGATRVIKTDRLYDFHDETNIIEIIDIRYPKKEYNINNIELSLSEKAIEMKGVMYLKLSDILNILYNKFNFDYVTIIDFACRVCYYDVSEEETKQEIIEGQNLKEIYKALSLGGGKKGKNNKNKSKKNKRDKRYKIKKYKTAKTCKKNKYKK